MEDTFSNCKQYISAEIKTLMSVFDGLGPSIFCRKMEEANPMRENSLGKVVDFRQIRYFGFDVVIYKVLFPFRTLTWRVNNYVNQG